MGGWELLCGCEFRQAICLTFYEAVPPIASFCPCKNRRSYAIVALEQRIPAGQAFGGSIFTHMEEQMTESRPYIPWQTIGKFMKKAFMGYGVPEQDAEICANVLMESDRRGIESHGCNRFKPIYIDRFEQGILKPVTEIEVLRETPVSLIYDVHDGLGMVASHRMMTELIGKAKTAGMSMGAIRNSSHFGIAGYWATMATKENLVCIMGTNARPSIAPTFGVEPMLGTNPITIGIPTDEDFPFVIDCATSITQRGAIEILARNGEPTPEGQVLGSDGKYMTDSAAILPALLAGEASFVPIGGYKGYGYATAIEILSAALAGGHYMHQLSGINDDGSPRPHQLGHFFILFNPEFMLGTESFKHTAGEILRGLRASRKAPGHDRIYTAGEREYLAWLDRKDKGVPMGESVQRELASVRDKLGLLEFKFPFENSTAEI